MRQFLHKLSGLGWRHALVLPLILYFSLGLALLGVRFGLAPYLDVLRPWVAARISQASGAQADLSKIQLSWRGWAPRLEIQGLRLVDPGGRVVLQVPMVRADWAWSGPQRGLRLQARGLDLSLGRLPDGRLQVMGHALDAQPDPAGLAASDAPPAWLQWVLAQPRIAFQDTTLRWHDQSVGAPALVLKEVQAVLQRQAGQTVGLSLTARAPAIDDAALDIRVLAADGASLAQGRLPDAWQAWLRLSPTRLPAWRAWLDLPDALRQGRVGAQFWLRSSAAAPRMTALLDVADLDWAFGGPDEGLRVPHAAVWAQGGLDEWRGLMQDARLPQGLAFDLATRDIRLRQAAWFDHPLDTGRVALRGQLRRDAHWTVQLQAFSVRNADIQLRGQGGWDSRGALGRIDVQGTIARARLDAIHRYLPWDVDADARAWLAKGLQAGSLRRAQWLLKGDLAEFPFGDRPQAGDFRVAGDFDGARIDFVPDAPAAQAWPVLQDMRGTADLHRMDLQLTAETARMLPQPGQVIRLWGLRARIPDMENKAILQVSGQTAADGAVYMGLMRHSPVGALLDGFFDEAVAAGDWRVPLSLTIPLDDAQASQVRGRVDIQQGRLQLTPQAPALQAVSGSVHFTEAQVQVVQPLSARLLGGAVRLGGALGDGAGGLVLQGRLDAKALGAFVGVPGMQRITGQADYRLAVRQQGRAYTATLESDTQGLALDFPAPLAKAAEQARALQLNWTNADAEADQLDIRWGDEIRLGLR
ncbi:YhdP family protein, partial [Castellaniella hirudinis]|uniref:YhdP family phospholipid transporter n=1 Tax=Castellaniella hirudinis TaxID=1144617 RepID=UPI0039C275EA